MLSFIDTFYFFMVGRNSLDTFVCRKSGGGVPPPPLVGTSIGDSPAAEQLKKRIKIFIKSFINYVKTVDL